jgi:16S rRNA (cytosine1402-N4)-methyltransferase
MADFKHYTVMKYEAVDALDCKDGLVYVDCTLGGGGHSELILKRISPNGKLISFDIDQDAIDAASERLKDYKNLTIVKSSYTNIKQVLKDLGIEASRISTVAMGDSEQPYEKAELNRVSICIVK